MKRSIKQYLKDLLQKADKQDIALSQRSRKIKWLIILSILFIFYLLSFMQPHLILKHNGLSIPTDLPPKDSITKDSVNQLNSLFELPLDSFEQLLNQQIHENTDKK